MLNNEWTIDNLEWGICNLGWRSYEVEAIVNLTLHSYF